MLLELICPQEGGIYPRDQCLQVSRGSHPSAMEGGRPKMQMLSDLALA